MRHAPHISPCYNSSTSRIPVFFQQALFSSRMEKHEKKMILTEKEATLFKTRQRKLGKHENFLTTFLKADLPRNCLLYR